MGWPPATSSAPAVAPMATTVSVVWARCPLHKVAWRSMEGTIRRAVALPSISAAAARRRRTPMLTFPIDIISVISPFASGRIPATMRRARKLPAKGRRQSTRSPSRRRRSIAPSRRRRAPRQWWRTLGRRRPGLSRRRSASTCHSRRATRSHRPDPSSATHAQRRKAWASEAMNPSPRTCMRRLTIQERCMQRRRRNSNGINDLGFKLGHIPSFF